ncbi:MAG: NAD-dependent epimerase/dehydratase family protein [Pseudonocardia sp.]
MTTDQTVLVTGAAGRVGSFLRSRLQRSGRKLRLLDTEPLQPLAENEEVVVASITDMTSMQSACSGVDSVIHLAGEASEADWSRILELNIHGTYTVLEAARREGVQRLIYASSNHAVGFFPREKAPAADYLFPQPDTYYGVSKVTGEALGSLYHDRYGLDVICIRILTCIERPSDLRMLSTWLSPDDTGRLFEACLRVEKPGFRVIWGVSANKRGWFSLDEAESIGYKSEDDAEDYAAELIAKFGELDPTSISYRLLGGAFCSEEFNVD